MAQVTKLLTLSDDTEAKQLQEYQYRPYDYIVDKLRWQPWEGPGDFVGQVEIIRAYQLALKQQKERQDFENNEITLDDLEYWKPGQIIQNWLMVDAGHNVGKTRVIAGLASHFFDCFQPSIVYGFAPQWIQINDLLFKEIRAQREGKGLPGEVLNRQPRINYKADHFAVGRAATNVKSKNEIVQGQHSRHLMFVVDEAEGIPKYIFDAIQSMASGGFAIVLVVRNPRTTKCRAHQLRSLPYVASYTISCFNTPNVVQGRDVIPGMVRRDYIEDMLEYCEVIEEHNLEEYTFELPWKPGTIYKPGREFLWRVLGIASEMFVEDTFCSFGRFDAAVQRGKDEKFEITGETATIGVDAARYGQDFGTIYICTEDWLWRSGAYQVSDSFTFYSHILKQMEILLEAGITKIEIRIDAGGGWGAGLIDLLNHDFDIQYRHARKDQRTLKRFVSAGRGTKEQIERAKEILEDEEYTNKWEPLKDFSVFEVNFNGSPTKPRDYYDKVTEMYYFLGQRLEVLRVKNPPQTLRGDVCERTYEDGMKGGFYVKKLVDKEKARDIFSHSPDDGDGAALAAAPSNIFRHKPLVLVAG